MRTPAARIALFHRRAYRYISSKTQRRLGPEGNIVLFLSRTEWGVSGGGCIMWRNTCDASWMNLFCDQFVVKETSWCLFFDTILFLKLGCRLTC